MGRWCQHWLQCWRWCQILHAFRCTDKPVHECWRWKQCWCERIVHLPSWPTFNTWWWEASTLKIYWQYSSSLATSWLARCLSLAISIVVDCGSLDDPENGQVELSSTIFGATANYNCSQGYSLSNGNSTRTCEASGEWSGDPPSCECKWLNAFVHSYVIAYTTYIYIWSQNWLVLWNIVVS